MTIIKHLKAGALFAAIAATCIGAYAQEAVIRKNLASRIPQMPKIEEVVKSPMPGLWELRVNGSEIMYTDEQGNFLIQGSLIDTRQRRNLTEERQDKLNAVAFDLLPVKDAFTIVRGNGKRKLAVFEDPNCGYCKRFERDLAQIDNVTVHVFLYPILSADSADKSRNIWCSKDKAKSWANWMHNEELPKPGNCDSSAIARNLEFGKKYKITGTPTLFFYNGSRVPGALPGAQVEKMLADNSPN